jgi:hypothetical protein
MKRHNCQVNFNFTPEQQEKFNIIYNETKNIHPHLMTDDVSKEKIKVIIANHIINDIKKRENVEIDIDNLEIKD